VDNQYKKIEVDNEAGKKTLSTYPHKCKNIKYVPSKRRKIKKKEYPRGNPHNPHLYKRANEYKI